MTIVTDGEVEARLLPILSSIDRPTTLGFLNAHGLNLCWDQPGIANSFQNLDFLLRDGIGIKLCCRKLGWSAGSNLNGTDFIPYLLRHRLGKLALLGTQSPWLDVAAEKLRAGGVMISAMHHGFESPEFYARMILEDRPDTVVLAMGMPKQEVIAALIKQAADWPVLIICGGAILDWIAERFARAPEFYRRNNIEWVYRLRKEPTRLFRRYVIGNPLLVLRLPAIARAAKSLQLRTRVLPHT